MADFKIKSAAGIGNKLLIKGQDQDVTDSSYAIQIGDAGASTLTNATMSGGSIATAVTGFTGIKNCNSFMMSGALTEVANDTVINNFTAHTGAEVGSIGSAVTHSSGEFTMPVTGIWLLMAHFRFEDNTAQDWIKIELQVYDGSSTWNDALEQYTHNSANTQASLNLQYIADIDNVAKKMRFRFQSHNTSDISGGVSGSNVHFLRIGDT